MKYEIIYTERAVKDLSRLDSAAKKRVAETLERYTEASLNYAKKMVDSALGTYRFRMGDYRVIFDIEGNELVVLRVGHRREIYRRG
ncbi:type II toxin-antitoxin system RelE/ParE family toxin [Candidatus Aerophobetes bacterium]|nr:type II toxin-antitoxin system RelE/ParE family toxin [Candidatus Aerophobetes bacterium]